MRFARTVRILPMIIAVVAASPGGCAIDAAELYVGRAMTSITPEQPVPLSGQMRTRISQAVDNPVTATALR